jgi:acyl-CoA thioesterase FadM
VSSIETYRGTVHRWEVDNVDHFTVAYYFARLDDATLAVLHALRLDPACLRGTGRTCATLACRVSFQRELRVGDILHIRSGVVAVEDDGLLIGHHVFDSGDGALCTTVLQHVGVVEIGKRRPLPLNHSAREAAEPLRIEWTGEATAAPPPAPTGEDGFVDATRDTIKPSEVDVLGEAGSPAFIHRFSAANAQVIGAFGMTPAYMRTEGRGFSTFEFKLGYPGTLRAGDAALVRSALVHVGNSSMRIFHRMTNARTGEVVATLEQSGVHLDLAARRPAPLPDALRTRAKAMLISSGQ